MASPRRVYTKKFPRRRKAAAKSARALPSKPEKDHAPSSPVEEALLTIYRDTDGSIPDLSHFDRRRRFMHPFLFVLLFFLVVIGGASVASVYFFAPQFTTNADQTIRIVVHGPKTVVSGGSATYVVTLENTRPIPVHEAFLQLRYPTGFLPETFVPDPSEESGLWNIGTLEGETKKTVEITGAFFGRAGQEETLEAVFTYTPENVHAEFIERGVSMTTIQPAPLTVESTLPEQVIPGEEETYTFAYTNTGEHPFTRLAFFLEFPDGMDIRNVPEQTTVDGRNVHIILGALGPKEEREITLKGVLHIDAEVTSTDAIAPVITGRIGFLVGETFFEQYAVQEPLPFVEAGFFTKMSVNGKTGTGTYHWGEALQGEITYENRGRVPAKDVRFVLEGEGKVLDWVTFEDATGGVRAGETVQWTKKEVPELAAIQPEGKGVIRFTVFLKRADDESVRDVRADARFLLRTTMTIGQLGQRKDEEIALPVIDGVLNSDVTLVTSIQYADDESSGGAGTTPLRVGEETRYRVSVDLRGHVHELRDLLFRIPLLPSVEWTGRKSMRAGNLEYDATQRTVLWTLNRLPVGIQDLHADFDVRFLPRPEHAGNDVPLVSNIQFRATDSVTGGSLEYTEAGLTTALLGNPS